MTISSIKYTTNGGDNTFLTFEKKYEIEKKRQKFTQMNKLLQTLAQTLLITPNFFTRALQLIHHTALCVFIISRVIIV